MQNDFITGPLGTSEARNIVDKVYTKIREAKKSGTKIIFTRDTHFTNYNKTLEGQNLPVSHCIIDTEGWQIIPELPTNSAKIFNKYTFGDRYLAEELAECYNLSEENLIELCGVCTDICVVSNVLMTKALFYNEADIYVDSSCCAGVTPEKHDAALEVMKSCQINVI